MTPLPPLRAVVADLPEVYQPIFGHPELSENASRESDDRLRQVMDVCEALAKQLQRPVRVLDLGCAQGWFSFNLGKAGAQVVGIDYLEQNINVCNMLVLENRELPVRFKRMEIEKLPEFLADNQFDLVLGLSVFHHLCFHNGKEWTRDLLKQIFEKIPVGLFEMALASETQQWAAAQSENSDYLIDHMPFSRILSYHATHLSSVRRPLYYCSSRFWYLNNEMSAFSSYMDNKNGRRYFFGDTLLAKLYSTSGSRGEINRYAIKQSAQFLSSPPAGYIWAPKLIEAGEDNDTAWLIQEKIPGSMVGELIDKQKSYDEHAILVGVLKQLAVLEKSNLYHADVRTWNILLKEDGSPILIDYNEVSPAKRDCVWPDSPFLAFFIFVHEVVTRRNFDIAPSRPPFISPFNLPEPYRSWGKLLWQLPVSKWSFTYMKDTLENLPQNPPTQGDTATELWMQTIERNLETLNETVRSMSKLVVRLHEIVVANHTPNPPPK